LEGANSVNNDVKSLLWDIARRAKQFAGEINLEQVLAQLKKDNAEDYYNLKAFADVIERLQQNYASDSPPPNFRKRAMEPDPAWKDIELLVFAPRNFLQRLSASLHRYSQTKELAQSLVQSRELSFVLYHREQGVDKGVMVPAPGGRTMSAPGVVLAALAQWTVQGITDPIDIHLAQGLMSHSTFAYICGEIPQRNLGTNDLGEAHRYHNFVSSALRVSRQIIAVNGGEPHPNEYRGLSHFDASCIYLPLAPEAIKFAHPEESDDEGFNRLERGRDRLIKGIKDLEGRKLTLNKRLVNQSVRALTRIRKAYTFSKVTF
jgi:hypothetical protein